MPEQLTIPTRFQRLRNALRRAKDAVNNFIKKHPVTFGVLSRIYREFVNGGDTGYTAVKQIVTFLAALGLFGAVTTAAAVSAIVATFILPVIIATAIVGVFYVISAAKDEYDRQQEIKKKKLELEELQTIVKTLPTTINERIKVYDESDVANKPSPIAEDNKEFLRLTSKLTGNEDSKELLRRLLASYLYNLGLSDVRVPEGDTNSINAFKEMVNRRKRADGKLPDQDSILRLIEANTVSRKDPEFEAIVKNCLVDGDHGSAEKYEFARKVLLTLGLNHDPKTLYDERIKASRIVNKVKTIWYNIRHGVKWGMFAYAKGNTALGLVIGSCVLGGLIVAGAPVTWPIIVGAVVFAVGSAAASLIYNRYVEKHAKQKDVELNTELKENKLKFDLLRKLHHVRTKKYTELNEYNELEKSNPQEVGAGQQNSLKPQGARATPDVSLSVKVRIGFETFFKGLYGFFGGNLVGIAVTSVFVVLVVAAHVLNPIFGALSIAGLIGGLVYGARYGWSGLKDTYKKGEAEKKRIQEVVDSQKECQERLGLTPQVMNYYLNFTKQALIIKLINAYVTLSKQREAMTKILYHSEQERIKASNDILTKKESILSKIEELSGVKRLRVKNLPNNEDPQFFNELSLYLQEDKKISKNDANTKATDLKAAVQCKERENCEPVNQSRSLKPTLKGFIKGVKEWSKKINRVALLKFGFPVLAALLIGLPLSFALFGPLAPIAVAVFTAVVVTVFIMGKICEAHGEKQMNQVNDTAAKLPVIETIVNLNKKSIRLEAEKNKRLDKPKAAVSTDDSQFPVVEELKTSLYHGEDDIFKPYEEKEGIVVKDGTKSNISIPVPKNARNQVAPKPVIKPPSFKPTPTRNNSFMQNFTSSKMGLKESNLASKNVSTNGTVTVQPPENVISQPGT